MGVGEFLSDTAKLGLLRGCNSSYLGDQAEVQTVEHKVSLSMSFSSNVDLNKGNICLGIILPYPSSPNNSRLSCS